jgi:amino-acid N-acetyltransferase
VTKKQLRVKVEKAKIGDAPHIHRLVNEFADRGEMLHRPLSEIYENIRDYFVVKDGDHLIGCVALHVSWENLAEIKAMAVTEGDQGLGLGRALAEACLAEARELGIPTIFCLTYKPAFFAKLGFRQIDVMELPRKVWGECYRCAKFPNCDEVAMIYEMEPWP